MAEMSRRDTKLWVREEIIFIIQDLIRRKNEDCDGLSLDELTAFNKELKRVKKLFKM